MTIHRILAITQVLCPFGAEIPDGEVVRDFFKSLPLLAALLLRSLFCVFYWLPPLIVFRLHTVTRLDPDAMERYLRWWEENRWAAIREAFMSLKTVALLAQIGRDWEPR